MLRLKLRPDAAVTLPDEIRAALHLDPGDELVAEVAGDSVVLRKAAGEGAAASLSDVLAGRCAALPDPPPTEEQVMADALEAIAEVRREMRAERGSR